MTREEIIEHLDSIVGTYEILLGHGVNSDILDVDDIEAIKEAISALSENKGEWIPVSERLPEIFRFVNCTCHSLIDDREDWVVETVYVPQPSNSPYSDWGNIPMLNNKECEVIAWMYREIPEPYMENENQTEKDILHKAIDNTKIAEDVYPNLRKELHEAVDSADMER